MKRRVVIWSPPSRLDDYVDALMRAATDIEPGEHLVYFVGAVGQKRPGRSRAMHAGKVVSASLGYPAVQWPEGDPNAERRIWCYAIQRPDPDARARIARRFGVLA